MGLLKRQLADAVMPGRSRADQLKAALRADLYASGMPGTARILKAPAAWVIGSGGTTGDFVDKPTDVRYRLEITPSDGTPYEAKVTQSVDRATHALLPSGSDVPVRIDPGKPENLLLCPLDDARLLSLDASSPFQLLRRTTVNARDDLISATATIVECRPTRASSISGRVIGHFVLELDGGAGDRTIALAQGIPSERAPELDAGMRLRVGYLDVDRGETSSILW